MTRSPEYIGVSGVVNQEQQRELEEMFADAGLTDRRNLQLGVKATHKPQYEGIENRYGREWYPVGREIDDALRWSPGKSWSIGMAQVCFDSERVHDTAYREDFLWKALGNAAGISYFWLNGIQFDMMPDWCAHPEVVRETLANGVYFLEDRAKQLSTVLQCQAEIMERHSPQEIARAVGSFGVDYVLLDASGGRGLRMNPDALLPYIEAVYNNTKRVGVAVGGGLNAEVVRAELPKILRHFPDVSWDAEGQLHPVNSEGKRPLDMRVCRDYLEACAEVLC